MILYSSMDMKLPKQLCLRMTTALLISLETCFIINYEELLCVTPIHPLGVVQQKLPGGTEF